MDSSGASGEDLQHAVVYLDVESQDMAAQIRQHVVAHEDIPKRLSVRRLDVALKRAGESIDGIDGMMTDDQLPARVTVIGQCPVEPFGLNPPFATER